LFKLTKWKQFFFGEYEILTSIFKKM